MKRSFLCIGVVLLVVWPLRAEPPAPKPVQETWDAVYIEGGKAGYFHTTSRDIERDGKKLLSCTQAMQLGIKREGAVVTVRVETGDEETADGKVVGVSLTQFAGKDKLTATGRVEDGQLVLRTSPGDDVRKLPWDDSVIGLAAQERIFADKKAKPGDQFTYLSFEPTLQVVTTVRVTVKEPEEVDVLEVKAPGEPGASAPGGGPKAERVRRKLLRAEVAPDKVKVNGKPLQLPAMTVWLNADLAVVRSETVQPGLGKFTVFRTTQAVAEEEGAAPRAAARPAHQQPHLAQPAHRPSRKGEGSGVPHHAQGRGRPGRRVRAGRPAASGKGRGRDVRAARPRPARAEGRREGRGTGRRMSEKHVFPRQRRRQGQGADGGGGRRRDGPVAQAQRIEKWVHDHMKVSTAVDYVPASRTAEDLHGDCRQHAMLTAAMCRAAKVPARTALGLVYDKDPDKGPVLAFHMWTEVWVKRQWMGVNAVWGEGGVGADHLKITDHVWSDTQTLAPLAAVTRVMGKIKVEVVEVK